LPGYAVPADRVTLLEALPGWTWDVLAARWEERFAALEAFSAREGHVRVPSDHNEGAVKLGRWVISQRQSGRKGALDAGRRARLEALVGWTWRAGGSDRASSQPTARRRTTRRFAPLHNPDPEHG
jgi:hypothetical protein